MPGLRHNYRIDTYEIFDATRHMLPRSILGVPACR